MVEKILFIEGTKDDSNGDLRQGFHKLLAQKLSGNMPRIRMGNGITTTIDGFKNNRLSKHCILLVDLDAPEAQKDMKLLAYTLLNLKDNVFFMIQEMEAWFLSQPEILDAFYGDKNTKKLSKKKSEDIDRPAEYLSELTKNTRNGSYHKVKHGVRLLGLLNAHKLEQSSTEFANLIKKLQMV